MFIYSAICDVPEQTLVHVTALLRTHRREVGTRAGRRAGTACVQAKLVLRWFRDDAPIRLLAAEAGLPISTSYRYLHEAIDVIAAQALDLHEVLEQARHEQWSHLTLDGTLIEIDRVGERKENGHHLWYSGKHKTQGGNVQILDDPSGFPLWSSPVASTTSPPPPSIVSARCTSPQPTVCPPWPTRATRAPGSGSTRRSRAAISMSRTRATTCCSPRCGRSGNAPTPNSHNAGAVCGGSACAQTESARSLPPR